MELSSHPSSPPPPIDRIHPRRRCHLRLERPGGGATAVKDIGLGGLRLMASDLRPGDIEEAHLHIPGSKSPCPLRYEVMHVDAAGGVGARFDGISPGARLRLTEYVDHVRSVELLKRLQARLADDDLTNLKPLGDAQATTRLMERLANDRAAVQVWANPNEPPMTALLTQARDGLLTLCMEPGRQPEAFDEVMLTVRRGDQIYLADTTVAAGQDGPALLVMPERVYRPERRRDLRNAGRLDEGGELLVEVGGVAWRLPILEESDGGLSVIAPAKMGGLLRNGDRWEAFVGGAPLHARVAYARPWTPSSSKADVLRVGLQRIVERCEVPTTVVEFPKTRKNPRKNALARGVDRARRAAKAVDRSAPRSSAVVRFNNRHGDTLVALTLRAEGSAPQGGAPLVVIPPAYGRKKEDTSGLALTIAETFHQAGQAVTVVRYDASGAVGESERSERFDGDAEYHNAGYTLSRGASDLEDVVDHFGGLPDSCGPVGIVSFSLSATVARRVIAEDEGRRIRSWVAPCGAADTRDLVRNSAGGVDYLDDHRRGARKGLRQVVGHVMDVDAFCEDAWRSRMADLAHARADMARIGIPVTWICGAFDYWVNIHRVADMITVAGPADASGRELVTVPTGHTVRNSGEAQQTFRIIAERLGRDLLGRPVQGAAPDPRQTLALSKVERDRLRHPDFDPRAYWSRYLLGQGDNPLGFDVITLTSEYQELMATQVEALGAQPGDRVVDLGAGTGNLSEALVESMQPARATGRLGELNLVDLVPEALATARAKLDRLQGRSTSLRSTVWCHAFDLSAVGPPAGGSLPFGDGSVDRVAASLLLSYLPDPVALLKDTRRILRPGGRVMVSSFLPDTDLSGPLLGLLTRVHHAGSAGGAVAGWRTDDVLDAVRSYVNDAAKLLDLACDGVFRFYDAAALERMLTQAGFTDVEITASFGSPGQAVIACGRRPTA